MPDDLVTRLHEFMIAELKKKETAKDEQDPARWRGLMDHVSNRAAVPPMAIASVRRSQHGIRRVVRAHPAIREHRPGP